MKSNVKKNINGIITDFKSIWNNIYDYSNIIEYINNKQKLKIICHKHGEFELNYVEHFREKRGCKLCKNVKYNFENFKEQANIIHTSKYKYENFINYSSKIDIICPIHGKFTLLAHNHLKGTGCSKCKKLNSKGEKLISNYLTQYNIEFYSQHKFENCKLHRHLKFDFYLPKYNLIIEYDGIQHFEIREHFGGETEFNKTILRDKIKTQYCLDNNIDLLRISYKENITNILSKLFNI